MVALLASMSQLPAGMGLGFPAITNQLLLKEEFSQSQVSWFASVTAITCPMGGIISGVLCDKIGRIHTLMFTNLIAIVSWIIIGLSSRSDLEISFIELMIARTIIGFNIGMTSTANITYVAETCHPSLRGRLSIVASPFFTALGILTIYFLGYLIPVSLKLSLTKKNIIKKIVSFRPTTEL